MAIDINSKSVLTKKQRDVMLKDVCFLILMLHSGSYLLYVSLYSLARDLQKRKRWSKLPPGVVENELVALDGARLGKWTVSVRGHYFFLS